MTVSKGRPWAQAQTAPRTYFQAHSPRSQYPLPVRFVPYLPVPFSQINCVDVDAFCLPTVTLVEDASHVSITADIETASTTVNVGVQCAINGGAETCSDVFVIDALSTTTQLLVMGTAAFTGVPIAPSATSASSSDQGTVTVTQSQSTTSASGTKAIQAHFGSLAISAFAFSISLPALLYIL